MKTSHFIFQRQSVKTLHFRQLNDPIFFVLAQRAFWAARIFSLLAALIFFRPRFGAIAGKTPALWLHILASSSCKDCILSVMTAAFRSLLADILTLFMAEVSHLQPLKSIRPTNIHPASKLWLPSVLLL